MGASPLQSVTVHRSRKLISPFVLHRPATVDDACALLNEYGDEATVIAGGIDVIGKAKMVLGLAHGVAVAGIAEMHGIRLLDDRLEIGAAVTHREVETNTLIRARMPAVREYIGELGNIRIRCQGTIGGNVMADEPGYEILPLLLALDATLNFCDPADAMSRAVAARDFARTHPATRSVCLLASVSIPLSRISLAWDRSLRPTMTLVTGVRHSNGRPTTAGAALAGVHRRAVWGPVPVGAGAEASELDASTHSTQWAAAMPEPN